MYVNISDQSRKKQVRKRQDRKNYLARENWKKRKLEKQEIPIGKNGKPMIKIRPKTDSKTKTDGYC